MPPDRIWKEALAYSELLGQTSHTIKSGKNLNMRVIGMRMHIVHNQSLWERNMHGLNYFTVIHVALPQ